VVARGIVGEPDDSYVQYPSVIFENGEYKMWYSAFDSHNYRIMYANSTDGLTWTKQGIAIELGGASTYDTIDAYVPSVIKSNEFQMWYTGFNGDGYWLLHANSTDGLNWNKHPQPVMVRETDLRYSEGRIAFSSVAYDGEYHMWYSGFDGLKHRTMYANSTDGLNWDRLGLAITTGLSSESDYLRAEFSSALITPNETKLWYSGYAADAAFRILYTNLSISENRTDLGISWTSSTSDDIRCYEICRANTITGLSPWQTYLTVNSSAFVENGIGDENVTNYYYRIRAVDKVGHTTECPQILGKIGKGLVAGWNLISNPFIDMDSTLGAPLKTIDWGAIMRYDTNDPTSPWKSNLTARPAQLNTLMYINQTTGLWVNVANPEVYAPTGIVTNVSINLQAGWNLIAYPYHEDKMMTDAVSGLPWDAVEKFDPSAPYKITPMTPFDYMHPGSAYWIHLTSATVWDAINL
jgi:predicted GH43/DUF377 family glycosyl hydrolase